MERRKLLTGIAATSLVLSAPALAQDRKPYTELWLCLDDSRSMIEGLFGDLTNNWYAQKEGHIEALRNQTIQNIMIDSDTFVRIVLWSDTRFVRLLAERRVRTPADIRVLVSGLRSLQLLDYPFKSKTRHEYLMQSALLQPVIGERRILDISTDEAPLPDRWRSVMGARNALEKIGTQVNVLSIDPYPELMSFKTKILQETVQTRQQYIPGSFTQQVSGDDIADYATGLISKLVLELS